MRGRRVSLIFYAVSLVSIASIVGLAALSLFENQRYKKTQVELGTPQWSSPIWSVSYAEVEFLKFARAVDALASRDPATIRPPQNRFEIIWSRVETLRGGSGLRELQVLEEYRSLIASITVKLNTLDALLFLEDDQIFAVLPDIAAQTEALQADFRALSLVALNNWTNSTQVRREQLIDKIGVGARVILYGQIFIALCLAGVLFMVVQGARSYNNLQKEGAIRSAVFEKSQQAIIVLDAEQCISEVNTVASRLLGAAGPGVVGQPISMVIPDIMPVLHGQDVIRVELTDDQKDGRIFEFKAAKTPSVSVSAILFGADITENLNSEKKLSDARDKAIAGEAAKARFLSVMSHEIRTPLFGLLGTLSLLRDTQLSDRQAELAERMDSTGSILLKLLNNVLDVSQQEAGIGTVTPVAARIDETLDQAVESLKGFASQTGNILRHEHVGPTNCVVLIDTTLLTKVVDNLVSNALKFTEDGEVVVRSSVAPDGQMAQVDLSVRDTGRGIPAEDLERVQQDFETVRSNGGYFEGTGLGLGIVRRIVAAFDGDMQFESREGEGTIVTIRFRVPLTPETQPSEPMRDAVTLYNNTCSRVLVVDDNQVNLVVAAEMLKAEGFDVDTASGGIPALEKVGREKFDLILMDINMPDMDGVRATQEIRASTGPNRNSSITAFTAHALPEEIEAFLTQGFNSVLHKPLDRRTLKHDVQRLAGLNGAEEITADVDEDLLSLLKEMDATALNVLFQQVETEIEALASSIGHRPLSRDDEAQIHLLCGSSGSLGLIRSSQALRQVLEALRRGEPAVIPSDWYSGATWEIVDLKSRVRA